MTTPHVKYFSQTNDVISDLVCISGCGGVWGGGVIGGGGGGQSAVEIKLRTPLKLVLNQLKIS